MMLACGAVFQMPVLVFALARMGIVTAGFMLRNFKYAVLIIAILGAVLSPGGDIASQMILSGPMLVLYILSIGVAWVFQKRKRSQSPSLIRAQPDSADPVFDIAPSVRGRTTHERS